MNMHAQTGTPLHTTLVFSWIGEATDATSILFGVVLGGVA